MDQNKVCVVGLGYIGLPTAVLLAHKGFQVLGVDVSERALETIRSGVAHIHEPDLDVMVSSAIGSGRFTVAGSPMAADIFVIAVPTPFRGDHSPDLSFVESAARAVAKVLREGNLVILESTSPPGTTDWIATIVKQERPDLSGSVRFAHCPERVLPGRILQELLDNDRIVGGVDEESTKAASSFYASFVRGTVHSTDARTAELCKLAENAYRDVNIAYANELSMICEDLGVDVWELIRLANRHPRVSILNPGPGVGGHCIAVDPWFIVHAAPESSRLIATARGINDHKPARVVRSILSGLRATGARRIACLGLSFKADIDDLRESPAVEIVECLLAEGLDVEIVEPHILELPPRLRREGARLIDLGSVLEGDRPIVLLVDHRIFRELDRERLGSKLILDTRGIWS